MRCDVYRSLCVREKVDRLRICLEEGTSDSSALKDCSLRVARSQSSSFNWGLGKGRRGDSSDTAEVGVLSLKVGAGALAGRGAKFVGEEIASGSFGGVVPIRDKIVAKTASVEEAGLVVSERNTIVIPCVASNSNAIVYRIADRLDGSEARISRGQSDYR